MGVKPYSVRLRKLKEKLAKPLASRASCPFHPLVHGIIRAFRPVVLPYITVFGHNENMPSADFLSAAVSMNELIGLVAVHYNWICSNTDSTLPQGFFYFFRYKTHY